MIVMCNNLCCFGYYTVTKTNLKFLCVSYDSLLCTCSFNLVGHIHKENKTAAGLDQSVEPFTAMRDVFGSFFGVGPKSWS